MILTTRTLDNVEADIYQRLDSGRERLQGAALDAQKIGELLLEGKALLPHGAFIPWAMEKFGFSDRHCRRLMMASKTDICPIQSGTLLLPDSPTINSGLMSSQTAEWYTPETLFKDFKWASPRDHG